MNILDAKTEALEQNKLTQIFNRQKELMEKYHDIEAKSGLMQTVDCPVNLDTKEGQARIKDFAWRVTEEVGEALDALSNQEMEHYQEELVDGLHFLTELSILANFSPEDIAERGKANSIDPLDGLFHTGKAIIRECREVGPFDVGDALFSYVCQMGMTCNCLKNKPWKQSQMLTDKEAFYDRLFATWVSYFTLLAFAFSAPDEVADTYLRKSQVNKFRQRSNY